MDGDIENAPSTCDDGRHRWLFFGLSMVAVIFWGMFGAWSCTKTFCSSTDGSAKAGQFGDTFGALNCLFSSVAVAGAIYTVFLQQKQFSAVEKRENDLAELQAISAYSQCLASCAQITFEKYKDISVSIKSYKTPTPPDLSKYPIEERENVVQQYAELLNDSSETMKRRLEAMGSFHETANDLIVDLTEALVLLRQFPNVAARISRLPASEPTEPSSP